MPSVNIRERTHVALLIAAFFALQFPQYLSGRASMVLVALMLLVAWTTRPRLGVIHGPLALLLVLMATSILWSEHPQTALAEVSNVAIVVAAGLSVGGTLTLASILKVINRATIVIAALSLILAVVAPEFALHSGPAYSGTLIGIYISKNSLALVILFGALAVLFREWPEGRARWKVFSSLALYGVVLLQAESATVSALLIACIGLRMAYGWWIRASGESRGVAAAAIITPIVLLSIYGYALYTGALALLDRDVSLTGRTQIWAAAIDTWRTRPWTGVGWGSYETDSTAAAIQFAHYNWVRNHAHSGYFQVLAELGILGLIILAIVLWTIARTVLQTIKKFPTFANGWVLTIFITFLAHNVLEQSMKLLPVFMLALIYAACTKQLVEKKAAGVVLANSESVVSRRSP